MLQAMASTFTRIRAVPQSPAFAELLRAVVRWALIGFGALLILLGFVAAVLPGHLGLPVVVVGLAVVLRNSMRAKREFVKLQRRRPNWFFPLRRLMRPKPEIAPVLWQGLLRSERLILSANRRFMGRLRRRLMRRRPRA
jgi:hypothetical protein